MLAVKLEILDHIANILFTQVRHLVRLALGVRQHCLQN